MNKKNVENNKQLFFKIQFILSLALFSVVIIPVFLENKAWPTELRNYLETRAVDETGAINIVSSIYLGYRAYDTLGETLVLLVAVSGTIGIIGRYGADDSDNTERSDARESRKSRRYFTRRRTVLMEVVTGKLGPVVLVFGLYVMLFGHMSPGGGFQGGVVIASGIIFISLGTKGEYSNILSRSEILSRIEAVSFLFLVASSGIGVFSGLGFFANPFLGTSVSPLFFIILLNTMIGLKVGSGIAYMSVAMMGDAEL